MGIWLAARTEASDVIEAEVRDALTRLDPLWDELFPAEQERIVRLLVQRVTVGEAGAEIRLNVAGGRQQVGGGRTLERCDCRPAPSVRFAVSTRRSSDRSPFLQ